MMKTMVNLAVTVIEKDIKNHRLTVEESGNVRIKIIKGTKIKEKEIQIANDNIKLGDVSLFFPDYLRAMTLLVLCPSS